MKQTIAVYRSAGSTTDPWLTFWPKRMGEVKGYVRLTEYTEVDFPQLSREETLHGELATLDAMAETVRNEAALKLSEIAQKRSELLALPAPVEPLAPSLDDYLNANELPF